MDGHAIGGPHIKNDVVGAAKIIAIASAQNSPVLRLLNVHTGEIPRRLGIKGYSQHCPVYAVQHVRIRRASVGLLGGINAGGVEVNGAEIAWTGKESRGESVIKAGVLVQIDIKVRLIDGDALIEELVCRPTDGAALGLDRTREKPKAQGKTSGEECQDTEITAEVTKTSLTFHTTPLNQVFIFFLLRE